MATNRRPFIVLQAMHIRQLTMQLRRRMQRSKALHKESHLHMHRPVGTCKLHPHTWVACCNGSSVHVQMRQRSTKGVRFIGIVG